MWEVLRKLTLPCWGDGDDVITVRTVIMRGCDGEMRGCLTLSIMHPCIYHPLLE